MRIGKISENTLKRSVLKQIKAKRSEVLSGAGIGKNCAIFSFSEEYDTVVSVHPVTAAGQDCTEYALYKAANNLAAFLAEPIAAEISLLLDESIQEPQLRAMMEKAEKVCEELGIQLAGGNTLVSTAVSKPIATVAGIGRRIKQENDTKARPGQDVVITKWIGMEGTAILAQEKEQELLTRYPVSFIQDAKALKSCLNCVPEAATAVKSGVCAMHDASEGGIFGALWEFAQGSGVGLEIDIKKLPIRQETIEVCEFLELNPYELMSGGAMIMAADNGFDLVKELEAKHIPAVVAGKVTDSNDRVVINEDERRFLELPKSDELYKIIQ